MFPQSLEEKFSIVDDPILKFIQKLEGKPFVYFDLMITNFVSIEMVIFKCNSEILNAILIIISVNLLHYLVLISFFQGIAAPFVLLVLGLDNIATQTFVLIITLAFLSQIPKRFIFRYRPYMVHR